MESFTKQQLVAAQKKWNQDFIENPEQYEGFDYSEPEAAEKQVNHLLSLVEGETSKVFSENELGQLQSKVHQITGDGEVMKLFNEMLGIQSGS